MTGTSTVLDTSRDRHLFGPGPKRMLVLDGGGVRGAISVAFLETLEQLLSEQQEEDVRLGDYFDFVGGTSTGAIIAGALALGFRAAQVKEFYIRLAPHAFKREFWRVPLLQPRFDARGLRHEIEAVIGDRKLSSPDLITGLGIVAKRMDTGSPWIISNNPRSPYWEEDQDHIGNKDYKLATLVRASTAAPHYFEPELIAISENKPVDFAVEAINRSGPLRFIGALIGKLRPNPSAVIDPKRYGLFVDGGVSPYNNPSFAFFQMIHLKAFGICWPLGPDKLTVLSVGTGTNRPRLALESLGFAGPLKLAYYALMSMMKDNEVATLAQMQWLGECPAPWSINSEIGTLSDETLPGGKLFRFLRYDVHLEVDWLSRLGISVSEKDVIRFRTMDDPGIVRAIYDIGCIAAKKYVVLSQLERGTPKPSVIKC
jgi:predicted acylesterase/phospholipase RssA